MLIPMSDHLANKIGEVVRKAPEWMRRELLADDPSLRQRAEETMAAMIVAAISPLSQENCTDSSSAPDRPPGARAIATAATSQNVNEQRVEEPNL